MALSNPDRRARDLAVSHIARCLRLLKEGTVHLDYVRWVLSDRRWLGLPQWDGVSDGLRAKIVDRFDATRARLDESPPNVKDAIKGLFTLSAYLQLLP